MPKLNSTQVGRAAEHYVVAEIHRRGGYAACFGGNMPHIDVQATDVEHLRTVTIQVKGKNGGRAWQSDTTRGRQRDPEDSPTRYWVLVDIAPESPVFYVMAEWWIQNDIHDDHAKYLERHGGHRESGSTHHSIHVRRVEQWQGRWDLLGIFPEQA